MKSRTNKGNKTSTIQIRVSAYERYIIDELQEMDGGFNLSDFVRKSLHEYGKIKGIRESSVGVGNFRIMGE